MVRWTNSRLRMLNQPAYHFEVDYVMALTDAENLVLRHETIISCREVIDAYFEEKERINEPAPEIRGLSTDQVEAVRIRKLATDLIARRATTYVATFKKFEKYPDEEEYRSFVDESRELIVDHSMRLFEESCQSFFANPAHPQIGESIRRSLPMQLGAIFSTGVGPVTSLFLEGKTKVKKEMKKSYGEMAFEILGVLKENGVNQTMTIADLARRVDLSEDDLWIYLKDFQNHGWVGLRMGGHVQLYYAGASAYLRATTETNTSATEIKTGDTFHTHNYGPSTNQIGGTGNVQFVSNVNPEIASVLNALLELVRASDVSKLDQEEISVLAERIDNLSRQEQTPEVIERKKKWFDWLSTAVQVGELSTKAAPLIEQLGRALGF